MNKLVRNSILLIALFSAVALFISVSKVVAQNPSTGAGAGDGPLEQTATPVGGQPNDTAVPSASSGDGLTEVDLNPVPLGGGGDGLPGGAGQVIPDLFPNGPDAPAESMVTFSYYRLVGTAFNNRTSATTFGYTSNGCVYQTGGADTRFMAPLLIPQDSTIKYLRLYYNDTSTTADITAWITRYQPGVTFEELMSVTSTGSSGVGTNLSSEITHTVDLVNWAYTIIIGPGLSTSANSFCGVRVAYYSPSASAAYLPLIKNP